MGKVNHQVPFSIFRLALKALEVFMSLVPEWLCCVLVIPQVGLLLQGKQASELSEIAWT
jgi:hypothetical protein